MAIAPDKRLKAIDMYRRGVAPTTIANTVGSTVQAVVMMARRAGCPPQDQKIAKALRRRTVQHDRDVINREMAANKLAAGLSSKVSGKAAKRDAVLLMAAIPVDTRTFTARFCGDPLPGRSALDQRRGRLG